MVHRLSVTAHVTWVTPSEDIQPLHPGVPQNAGCTPSCSPIKPPTSLFSLDHSIWCLLQPQAHVGGSHYDTSHVCKLPGGRQSWCAYAQCHTVHFSLDVLCFLTHTHTQAACSQTPRGGSGNPPSDPNVTLKAEPKPTTVVCCGILWGAFRSCQFVQVGIKKTS